MKKKLFALMMGVGMAFGSTGAMAYFCVCDRNYEDCIDRGGSHNGCIYNYNHCMDIHDWDPSCNL